MATRSDHAPDGSERCFSDQDDRLGRFGQYGSRCTCQAQVAQRGTSWTHTHTHTQTHTNSVFACPLTRTQVTHTGVAAKRKGAIATRYLKQFGKSLDERQLQLVVGAAQTSSPLYLRVLLEGATAAKRVRVRE